MNQEPDRLPMRKLLVLIVGTLVAFGLGIAYAAARVAGEPLSVVPPPSGTVQHTLIRGPSRGLLQRPEPIDRWGWVDRDGGIARIPIDRAIDVVAEERR